MKPLASKKPLANEKPLTQKLILAALIATLGFIPNYSLFAQEVNSLDQVVTETTSIKNVILIIGDGMDEQQITIARNYLKGPAGQLNLDTMPFRGTVKVLTVEDSEQRTPIYVADSANSATAMASGITTSRGRIGTSAGDDKSVQTIVELAASRGFKTGIVTTASVTDATPASFAAHINFRFCESPETMENEEWGFECNRYRTSQGGPGSISEQLAGSSLDVLLGGGAMHFSPSLEDGSGTVLALAKQNGFKIIESGQALAQSNPADKILGLFAEKHLATKLQGEDGRVAEPPSASLLNSIHWSQGSVELPEPMACEDNPDFAGTPSIKQMTRRALAHLSHNNATGFFLMIESASIDKSSHARNSCGSIGELDQLDETTQLALDYAAKHPDTLVLVTADHGQAAKIIPNNSLFSSYGVPIFTPGSLVRIKMPSGGIMAVNYATNTFFAEEHSGVDVPLYANQIPANGAISIKQSDIFFLIKSHLNL